MTTEKTSNAVTIKKFFGLKPGQTTGEFLKEFQALSPEEKEQLAEGIKNESCTY